MILRYPKNWKSLGNVQSIERMKFDLIYARKIRILFQLSSGHKYYYQKTHFFISIEILTLYVGK